ncbi:MAG: ParA family protein [Pyrinomonadaceae bacterium]
MIISIASFKGGVSKTTTAIHIANALNRKAPTLLADGDPNESAIAWRERGKLPFSVISTSQLSEQAGNFKHIVLDTPARPTIEELKTICQESDLVIIPTQPDGLGLDALIKLITSLKEINATNYKVLFTLVPARSNAGKEAKELLKEIGAPFFKTEIQRRAVCGRAALKGITVNEMRDGQEAWKEFQAVSKEILKYEQK